MTDVDFSEFTRQAGIVKEDGTWSDSSNYHSYFIPVDPENRYIQVRVTAGKQSQIAFLTSKSVSVDQQVSFCNGETGRRTIKANTTSDFILPPDCLYIWVLRDGKSVLYTPIAMTFVTSTLTTETIQRETDIAYLNNKFTTELDEFQNSFNKIGIIENLAESATWTEDKYINAASSHADFGKMLTTSSLSATDFI